MTTKYVEQIYVYINYSTYFDGKNKTDLIMCKDLKLNVKCFRFTLN